MAQEQQFHLGNLVAPEGSRKERIRRGRGIGSGLGKTAGRGGKDKLQERGRDDPEVLKGDRVL